MLQPAIGISFFYVYAKGGSFKVKVKKLLSLFANGTFILIQNDISKMMIMMMMTYHDNSFIV